MSDASQHLMQDEVDIRTVEITSWDSESLEMEYKAKEVAQILTTTYPDHPWMVGWAPGMTLIVKHMAGDNRYGFTIDACKSFSASDLARSAKMAGGELLERLGLPRTRWNGEGFGNKYEGQTK